MAFIAIYITNPNTETAQKIVQHLLEKKLVACANIFPIKSAYWWEGAIATEGEVVCLVKSRPELWEAIQAAVTAIHPYTVPCIMKYEVAANAAYEDWIRAETLDKKESKD